MGKFMEKEVYFMNEALKEAKKAYDNGDVPIGCVIVKDNKIVAKAYNKRNYLNTTIAHAEIIAIHRACEINKDFRLDGYDMYVTLEPCQMCAGAIIQSRIDNLYIGANNMKSGCCGTILNIVETDLFNHRVNVKRGILENETSSLIKEFFINLRKEKKGNLDG